MSRPTYRELIEAGYKPEQIVRCPWNDALDQCPCDKSGPQKECGLARASNTTGESP